jgi:hypothetical protein
LLLHYGKHTSKRVRDRRWRNGEEKGKKVSQVFSSVRYILGEEHTPSEPKKEYKSFFRYVCVWEGERKGKGDEMNIIH